MAEPRTFKLYDELEKAEKGQLADQSVTYGLDDGNDQSFTNWNGTIVGPANTKFDGRIYFLGIVCGPNYPATAPSVQFRSKINIPGVNQSNGAVNFSQVAGLQSWDGNSMSMEYVLIQLKKSMQVNKNLNQPQDGDMY